MSISGEYVNQKTISFSVHGKPVPKGSTVSFASPKTGRLVTKADCENLGTWTQKTRWLAKQAMIKGEHVPAGEDVPVSVNAQFYFPRPMNHYRKRKGEGGKVEYHLRDDAPAAPTRKGLDIDKGLRALFDAMTWIVYHDDSQVTQVASGKHFLEWNEEPRTDVHVEWRA